MANGFAPGTLAHWPAREEIILAPKAIERSNESTRTTDSELGCIRYCWCTQGWRRRSGRIVQRAPGFLNRDPKSHRAQGKSLSCNDRSRKLCPNLSCGGVRPRPDTHILRTLRFRRSQRTYRQPWSDGLEARCAPFSRQFDGGAVELITRKLPPVIGRLGSTWHIDGHPLNLPC